MTDEQPPEPRTRRARLATRRHRVRVVVVTCLIVLVVAGAGTAVALRAYDADSAPYPDDHKAATNVGAATEPNLQAAKGLRPPRKLSHDNPLRLWIGGDSLAGSFGPALGQTAGATGVVDATIDYKVSSGLADQGIRDWPEHAQEKMASDDPDAVVFIIGTNDAPIVNTYDANGDGKPDWEKDYREKIDRMMETFVGGKRHRTVFWLGPPTLGDSTLDRGAEKLGPVMAQEAKKFAPDVVYVDTYRLFAGSDGGYSRELPDATGEVVQMRISDGVHFTVDGAQYLGDVVWKLLNKRWQITKQAVPSQPIEYTIAEGSNDYVPGVGHYRPPVDDGSSNTTPDTNPSVTTPATTPNSVTPTTSKATPSTTPPTTKTTSPPVTVPHVTTPHP